MRLVRLALNNFYCCPLRYSLPHSPSVPCMASISLNVNPVSTMGNLLTNTEMIEERLELLRKKLLEKYQDRYKKTTIDFTFVKGKKYIKMVLQDPGASVHAFICRHTGAVYKPASWRAPAKYARYNLLDDVSFQQCLDRCDWAGGYLYLK